MPIDISDVRPAKALFIFYPLICDRIETLIRKLKFYKGTLDHSAYIYNQFVRREDFRLLGLYRVTEILIWENAVESFSLRNVEEFDVPHLPFNELKGHLRFIFTDVYLGQGCIDR